ncbi:hypothetical protein JCM1841_006043 [Sporobolomyces salmonicolor]
MSSPPSTSADADHFFQTLLTHDDPTSFTASTSSPSSSLLQLAPELSTSARPISFSSAFSQPQRRSAAATPALSTAGATFASGAFDLPFVGGPDDSPTADDAGPIAGPGPSTVSAALARAAVTDPYELPPAASGSSVREEAAYEALLQEAALPAPPSRSSGAVAADPERAARQTSVHRERGARLRGTGAKRAARVDDETAADDAGSTVGRERGIGRQRGPPAKKSAVPAVVENRRIDDIAVDPALGAASSFGPARSKGKGRARSSSAGSSFASADDDDLDDRSGVPDPLTSRSASASRTRSASGSPQPKKGGVSKSKPKNRGKKAIDPPIVPRLFRSAAGQADDARRGTSRPVEEGEGEGELTAEQEAALERAMDPSFATHLLTELARHQAHYERAYEALKAELTKAQIEESVLNNVKTVVLERRSAIRAAVEAQQSSS